MTLTNTLALRLEQLGITKRHCSECKLPAYPEATQLESAELDIFDRPQQMTRDTLIAWNQMRSQAADSNIQLQLVSAYRSIDYQCNIIQGKLTKGLLIEDILKVNAIPGFSEHHTGCALDLTTPDCQPLEEEFENTRAFQWLQAHAEKFNFFLSYPKHNTANIIYEPWHWAFRAPKSPNSSPSI